MEVSGRGATTRSVTQHQLASDNVSTGNQCGPCGEEGLTVDAAGFCTDCPEYVCDNCMKQHKRFKSSKEHVVLSGEDFQDQRLLDTLTDECDNHPGEPIKFYCKTDNVFVCIRCFTEGHKSCDTGLIADLITDVETSEEMKGIQLDIEQQKKRADLYRKVIQEYHLINNNCHDKCLDDFHTFRTEIVNTLDRLGEVVSTEAGKLRDDNKMKLDDMLDTLSYVDQDRKAICDEISMVQKLKKNDKLFVTIKKNKNKIQKTEEKLEQLNAEIDIEGYSFNKDPEVKHVLDKMATSSVTKVSSDDVTLAGKINVKSRDDGEECVISGMVEISPSILVVTDLKNKSLKLVYFDENAVTKRLQLSSDPFDITVVPGSRVAVTLPNQQQIQLFSTSQSLDPCGIIDVDGGCLGIESTGDQLLVSFVNPVKVEIMDLEGQILKSVVPTTSGSTLFDKPRYLCVNSNHFNIYISDWKKKTVTSLDNDGNVQWTYENEEHDLPGGVVAGINGSLLICSRDTHSLHVVSPTGRKLRVIPLTRFQIQYPWPLCRSQDERALYVSSGSSEPGQGNYIRRLVLH